MVNSILQYIEPQLKAYMQFLNRVDSPVFRISNGEMIKGNGQEKELVTISDLNGNSLYIRQTQPETINERKALSSCDKEYNISARCKVVFYTFGGNDFTINPDKVKSKIVNTLARLDFSHYTGTSSEIKIDVNGTSLDLEKIYTEETGKEFTGNVWPTLVTVDFTLSYVDTNCNTCDIEDNDNPVSWSPEINPDNCETKAICEVISKCDIIVSLQEETVSLQEQIDNLPPPVSTQTLSETLTNGATTGEQTIYSDNTDSKLTVNNSDARLEYSPASLGALFNGLRASAYTAWLNFMDNFGLGGRIKITSTSTEIQHDLLIELNAPSVKKNTKEIATEDFVDNRVQSNIKIIGDWDASSGSYPLADESNTTPFITQWGATIKAGWAFRVGYGQQGTVDGFDYENGDVVYALIDNPTNFSTDWGDLDHNLQQANESLRGTAKIITAAIAADETTTDDERIVTGKKLWTNFWTRVLYLAHTWAAKQTFTTAPRFNSASASQYLKTDASKDLTSVSAIPAADITQSTNLRFQTDNQQTFNDATSSIQTQLNSLINRVLFKNTTNSPTHTGTLVNSIIYSEDISNKLSSGDIAEIISDVVRVSGSTAATIRYYLNSSASLSGATQIGVYTYGFSGLNIIDFRRQLIVKSSTVIRVKGTISGVLNDYGAFSNYTDVTVDLSSLHIIFAITLGNTGDQFLVSSRKMTK